jgi:ADP-ribose pyrophosphatase YjhB (NUDIX family)
MAGWTGNSFKKRKTGMMQNFLVSVKAVIFKKDKILILKKITGSEEILYDLPGGRINDSESIEETLERELKEEVDLDDYKQKEILGAARLGLLCRYGT